MVTMATKRFLSKSAKIRSENDSTEIDIKIPTDEAGATKSKQTASLLGTIQAEKPKLVFSPNGTLVLQKPKLKVVNPGILSSEKPRARLTKSLNLETERSKAKASAEQDEKRPRLYSEKEKERPKLKRTLSGSTMTRTPGLIEVESYMSKQDDAEKSEKVEKTSGPRLRGKSRSLKLRQSSKDEVEPEQQKSPEATGTPKQERKFRSKSPEATGTPKQERKFRSKTPGLEQKIEEGRSKTQGGQQRSQEERPRSKTPGPEMMNRSRKPEKGILKAARSKSSDSTFNDDEPEVIQDKNTPKEQRDSYITSFGTKHGQRREKEAPPDVSHLDQLTRGRPKSKMESADNADDGTPKSRDDSPSDYESAARQIRRVHKELKGKEAKSFQELKYYNMTSKEERDEIDRIQEEIAKKLAEEKLMKELQNCSYLRRGPVEELSVEDVFAKD